MQRLESSYRSSRGERTWQVARPHMAAFGISRVTDVTRMDRLGLPVFVSVRPRGRTLRVHAGKGLRPLEARVGALMEGIEFAVAEGAQPGARERVLTAAHAAAGLPPGVRFVDLAPDLGKAVRADDPVATVECESLADGHSRRLPSELIFFPCDTGGRPSMFAPTTTGLASGNSLAEATLHAVFEVFERDALSMNKAQDASSWIEHADLPEPWRRRAAAWRATGVNLAVRRVPDALGAACFEATLHEPGSATVSLAAGSGLHVDREVALARAVCEAAQSRLSHIHGGRDDVTAYFAKFGLPGAEAAEQARIDARFDRGRRIAYADVAHEAAASGGIGRLLAGVLARMADAGFRHVFRYRFALPVAGLHVVKVVVPGCADAEHHPRRIGPRLMDRILRGT